MSATRASKRINFTGRHRIKRDWAIISIRTGEPGLLLSASVDLSRLDLPPDSAVLLEVSARTRLERFQMGTVAEPAPLEDHVLGAVRDPDDVRMRIKVVGGRGELAGRLLAVADKLRPEIAGSPGTTGRPLLRFRSDDGLGQVPWSLDLADDDPVVLVNSKFGDWQAVASSPEFISLVYPEILRQVAVWVATTASDGELLEGALRDWDLLLSDLGNGISELGADPDPESIEQWATRAAGRFAARFSMTDKACSVLLGGEDG